MNNFPFLLQAAVSYMSVSYWRGLAVQETDMLVTVIQGCFHVHDLVNTYRYQSFTKPSKRIK